VENPILAIWMQVNDRFWIKAYHLKPMVLVSLA